MLALDVTLRALSTSPRALVSFPRALLTSRHRALDANAPKDSAFTHCILTPLLLLLGQRPYQEGQLATWLALDLRPGGQAGEVLNLGLARQLLKLETAQNGKENDLDLGNGEAVSTDLLVVCHLKQLTCTSRGRQ